MTESGPDVLSGESLIGSARVRGTEGEIHGTNPRTGEQLEPAYGLGGSAEVERAAALAWDAYPSFRETGPKERAAFLEGIADNIQAVAEPLVARVIAETGIVEPRVRGELARTVNQLRLFAIVVREGSWTGARVDTALPDRQPLPRPDIRQRKISVGPVAVFGASNFPLAFSVAGGDTAAALAAGSPVVVKAHEAHPGTSEIVGLAIQRTVADHGLQEGVFSMLYGSGRGLGTALVSDPRIRAVGFTGSRQAGLALVAAAAARPMPIPVYAEMSSLNPVFVLPGALAARGRAIGRDFIASLTMGVGQLCTNPGLVFVVDGPGADEFQAAAAEAAADSAAAPMLNTGICSAYASGVAQLTQNASVELLAAGQPDDSLASPGQTHVFTTTAEAFLANPALQAEVFGATSVIVRLSEVTQIDAVIDALEGQLTAALHTEKCDLELAGRLVQALEPKVGRILFNGWPTGVEVGYAMVHGGPYPATSDGRTTSVGTLAIERFLRPVAYQNMPPSLLPAAIDVNNSLGSWRQVDGEFVKD